MFVPLDTLYDYLDDVIKQDLVIYRFWPHGSKNLEHLTPKRDYTMFDCVTRPIMICHDQEPLNWDLYGANNLNDVTWFKDWPEQFRQFWFARNLRSACEINIHDRCILTHSEYNSSQVEQYHANGFEPVYVWSHALLARDWYRYAMVDPKLQQHNTLTYDFNIYARAWSGSREYRLLLLSMLSDIAHHCRVTFSTQDQGHYLDHKFVNPRFDIHNLDLENLFGNTQVSSHNSATYDADHYTSCAIDVVLETIFDESRIYLTEKTLRPLACAQPFILVAPAGSLRYLQNYGFETFDTLIDESYDQEVDPVQRLRCIAQEMQRISRMPQAKKIQLHQALRRIAERNQQHFFSQVFFSQVVNEYMVNMQQAIRNTLNSRQGTEWHQHLALYDQYPDYKTHNDVMPLWQVQSAVMQCF
jgi:hypothetical protein